MKALVAIIVGAGAAASAIGAILALRPGPTPELQVEFSKVTVERGVTPDEYAAGHGLASVRAGTAAPARLVALQQTTTDTATTEEATTEGTTTGETTTGDTPTTPTTTEATTTEGTTTTEGGEVVPGISEEARAEINEGVRQALGEGTVAPPLGDVCRTDILDAKCPINKTYMKVVDEDGDPLEVTTETVADRVRDLLAGTRAETVGSRPQLVGVTVNFNVTLTGFRGRTVAVRWSLHRASGGGRVPRAWLRNQPALWLVGEATKDSASSDFWVPLPKTNGPFFARIAAYDEDGTRLDYEDTPEFD